MSEAKKSRLMSSKEACAETTLSTMQLRIMSEKGEFPMHVKLSTARISYVRAEVESWINARLSARDSE